MSGERWFRYLRWAEWPRWAAIGWVFSAELGPPHGFYSGLWEWGGVGPPREPGPENEAMSRRSEAERLERERRADYAIAGKNPDRAIVDEVCGAAEQLEPREQTGPLFDLCLYHKDCADGFAAAWAVEKRLRGIEMIACGYGDAPPDVRGRRVVIVDFSYSREVIDRMGAAAAALLVIDHHATAQAALAHLPATPARVEDMATAAGPRALFDMRHSGAMLAWRYFHADAPAPALIEYVEDRDLWRFDLDRSHEVNAYIGAEVFALATWNVLERELSTVAGLTFAAGAGATLIRQRDKDVAAVLAQAARRMSIAGHAVPACNAPKHLASDIGHALADRALFAAVYFDRADGRREFSLRSADHGADVAMIARSYGGGGHKHAAGFIAERGWEGDASPPPAPSPSSPPSAG